MTEYTGRDAGAADVKQTTPEEGERTNSRGAGGRHRRRMSETQIRVLSRRSVTWSVSQTLRRDL